MICKKRAEAAMPGKETYLKSSCDCEVVSMTEEGESSTTEKILQVQE